MCTHHTVHCRVHESRHNLGGVIIVNRIAVLGSLVTGLGFFFLPILEIRPNRLASGLPINLLELQGDFRYIVLFVVAVIPLLVALQQNQNQRGWLLVGLGNLIMLLTLTLPAQAGTTILEGAATMFEEGTRISNPRVFTSAAIATGLLGGYIVLFGGLIDLEETGTGRIVRGVVAMSGLVLIVLVLLNGGFDIYSIMVEFSQRGETLWQRFVEHFVFVIVSLIAGLFTGIALGLWASRDERVEPIILYAVGIIQTIPSLALFGVLLVPLARLGDQSFTSVLVFFIVSLIIGVAFFSLYNFTQRQLPSRLKTGLLVTSLVLLFIPISLFVIIVISFGFEAVLELTRSAALRPWLGLVGVGYLASIGLVWLYRRANRKDRETLLRRIQLAVLATSTVGLVIILVLASQQLITRPPSQLTIRDLGVSGIGTAPAIIALTLYSLLPLVRNTYAGLNNIDPAIIDAGRGMGMTPSQIFFQIELPLAFPVIMAGVRSAGISLVGIAAVASIIGAGALGDFILLGVNSTSVDLILLGALPAIVLAVLLDTLMQLIEAFFTSPGIRQV